MAPGCRRGGARWRAAAALTLAALVTLAPPPAAAAAAHRVATKSARPAHAGAGLGDAWQALAAELGATGQASSEAAPAPAAAASPLPPITVAGASLTAGGAPITLIGANWFGFENGQTFVDGLWAGKGTALTHDVLTVLWRIKLLGFNALRLPFSFKDLASPPKPVIAYCSPVSAADVAASITKPGVTVPAGAALPPLSPTYPTPLGPANASACNAAVPSTSTRDRFLWLLRTAVGAGFYVVIDDHISYDTLLLDDAAAWVSAWAGLAADLAADPLLAGTVLLDLVNEPDARGVGWAAGPSGKPGMAALYLRAMDAVDAVHPAAIYLLEGCGQLGTVAMNWGDGYVTDEGVARAGGVPSAAPFFEALLTRRYRDRVVLAPHIYPPSVSLQTSGITEPAMTARLDASFGGLAARGYCRNATAPPAPAAWGLPPAPPALALPPPATCLRFPIVIGEVGSKLANPTDVKFLVDFGRYLAGGGAAAGGRRAAGVFWWSWNANSGDTGGLVADDWETPVWAKLDWMTAVVGLKPWSAAGNATSAASPPPAAPPATTQPPPPPATTQPPPPPATTQPPVAVPAPASPPQPSPPPPPAAAIGGDDTALLVAPGLTTGAPPPPPAASFGCLASIARADKLDPASSVWTVEVSLSSRGAPPPCCAPVRLQFFGPTYRRARTARAWTPDGDGAALPGGVLSGTLDGGLPLEGSGAAAAVAYSVDAGDGRPAAVAVNGVPCALA